MTLAFVVLAAAGLFWLLDRIGFDVIADRVVELGWLGVALACLLGVVESALDAAAYRCAVPEPVGLIRILAVNQTGSLINRIIPWEAGEIVKGTLLTQDVSTSASVTGTLIWNYLSRFTKPIVSLGLALAGWCFGSAAMTGPAGWTVLAAVLGFTPYAILFVATRLGVAHTALRILKSLRLLRRDPEGALARAREIDQAVRRFSRERPAAYRRFLAYQILARLASWLTLYVVLVGIDPNWTLADSATVWVGLGLLSYVVALLPGRLGPTEAGGFAVFALLDLDGGLGVTVQCIMTAKAVVVGAVLALPALRSPRPRARPADLGAAAPAPIALDPPGKG